MTAVTLAGLTVVDVDAATSGRAVTALSKVGRLVLGATLDDGQRIKIYEAGSPRHARFIRDVSNTPAGRGVLPRVLAVDGSIVIAEWVEADEATEVTPAELARVLMSMRRINEVAVVDESRGEEERIGCGFDYWFDFVRPRFVRALAATGSAGQLDDELDRVDGLVRSDVRVLMHPDVTPANLLRRASGGIVVVDNELLATFPASLPIDVCNSFYALRKHDSEAQLLHDALVSHGAHDALAPCDLEALEVLWLARLAGSAFYAGRLLKVAELVAQHLGGESVVPRHAAEVVAVRDKRRSWWRRPRDV